MLMNILNIALIFLGFFSWYFFNSVILFIICILITLLPLIVFHFKNHDKK
jgi:hypothetical protein